ncbi:ScbR family autoregulator-binding transcription factor [Streptomyces uncialis]|uniref:ScbR family autoregulator-binding transcription factor n=1 Tax=Streptomyces uncialis TaxID=1048205 RepID=UPI003804C97C
MARQARAIQTRESILLAAAAVFDERGYSSATITEILQRAGVTKGALYFHFASKEELALGVVAAQLDVGELPPQRTRLQELVDHGMLFAHQLRHDPLTRAGVGLAMDHRREHGDDPAPFHGTPYQSWIDRIGQVLADADRHGELLPHVVPDDTAQLLAGAFTGIQGMSQTLCERADLTHRVIVLLQHVLPSIAQPSLLPTLDLGADRAERLLAARVATVPGTERADTERPGDGRAGDGRAGDGPAGDGRAVDGRAGAERPGMERPADRRSAPQRPTGEHGIPSPRRTPTAVR